MRYGYDMNSLAVPRKAKEAIGGIAALKKPDGKTLTINVEYNLLDPLLRASGWADGDINDDSGYSPYPGAAAKGVPHMQTCQTASNAESPAKDVVIAYEAAVLTVCYGSASTPCPTPFGTSRGVGVINVYLSPVPEGKLWPHKAVRSAGWMIMREAFDAWMQGCR